MASHNEPYKRLGLTPKQERFVLAVVQTDSQAAAAKQAGITTRCASKWMKDTAILARIKAARRAVFEQAIGQIQSACTDAVRVLRLAMLDLKVAWSVRVRAADCILSHALGANAIEELSEKITALEAAVYNETGARMGRAG